MQAIEELGFVRALVVQAGWCDQILRNAKAWEMRSTKTNVRGTIGLIESGSGLIVGKVNLTDSLEKLPEDEFIKHVSKHGINDPAIASSKWKYPWVLENAKRFDEPVRYRHPKGAVIWVKLTNEMLKG